MTAHFSWPFRKGSKQQGAADASTDSGARGDAPRTGISQAMEGQGASNVVGQGTQNVNIDTQNNYNVTISDTVIAKLFADLVRVLSGLEHAPALINEVAPGRDLDPDRGVGSMLGEVAELLIGPGQLPAPLQVTEIARQRTTDPGEREVLEGFGNQWAAQVPGGQPVLDSFRDSIKPRGHSDDPCLLVILDPDRTGGGGYRLSLILFRNGRDGAPESSNDDALRSLDEIRTRLQEVLPPLLSRVNRLQLLMEFVVPPELFNADFDRWSFPERTHGQSTWHSELGLRFPVVVRDLLRLDPDDDHALWRKRWQYLSRCNGKVPSAVCWPEKDGHTYNSLTASLMLDEAHREVCLALLTAPSVDTPAADLLSAGLTAGIPAAIWLRYCDGSENGADDDKKYLASAVETGALNRLPREVLKMRQKAESERQAATHPGRHLSLLWDDPNRMWSPGLFHVPPPASPNGAN